MCADRTSHQVVMWRQTLQGGVACRKVQFSLRPLGLSLRMNHVQQHFVCPTLHWRALCVGTATTSQQTVASTIRQKYCRCRESGSTYLGRYDTSDTEGPGKDEVQLSAMLLATLLLSNPDEKL